MRMPGGNVYKMATKIIGKQDYIHFSATSRALDVRGEWVTTFDPGVALRDSIQAVPRSQYAKLGLSLSKYYIMIYTDNPLLVLERATSGDQIEFESERYDLPSDTDWRSQDGWQGVLAVRLPATVTL